MAEDFVQLGSWHLGSASFGRILNRRENWRPLVASDGGSTNGVKAMHLEPVLGP